LHDETHVDGIGNWSWHGGGLRYRAGGGDIDRADSFDDHWSPDDGR